MKKSKYTCILLILMLFPSFTGADVDVYFSPRGYCEAAIICQITSSQSTIDIAMYSFTSEPIAGALVDARNRGVFIRVLLDTQQAGSRYSRVDYLDENGIEVRVEDWSGYMHHKFAVIDSSTLIVGSYNWTANAEESNNENLLIIRDDSLSMVFLDEFQGMWDRVD